MPIKANEVRMELEEQEKKNKAIAEDNENKDDKEKQSIEEEEIQDDKVGQGEKEKSDDNQDEPEEGDETENEESPDGEPDEDIDADVEKNSETKFEKRFDELLSEVRKLQGDKSKEANEDKEWTLQELRQVEARIEAGELDPKYKSWVAEKRSEVIANNIAAKTTARFQFQSKWSESMAQSKKDFPDLKNPKSELFKEARKLVMADPGYQKYLQLVASGKTNIDPSTLVDPDLQYKSAERAAGRLSKKTQAQPKSKTLAKDALEGSGRSVATTVSPGRQALDKLEAQAVKTGSQNDWKNYFSAREKHLKVSKNRG